MAQKLLLFWRKPARRCWWEGIDLENVDGVEGTLKVWIRRVWTLEMVTCPALPSDLDPHTNPRAERHWSPLRLRWIHRFYRYLKHTRTRSTCIALIAQFSYLPSTPIRECSIFCSAYPLYTALPPSWGGKSHCEQASRPFLLSTLSFRLYVVRYHHNSRFSFSFPFLGHVCKRCSKSEDTQGRAIGWLYALGSKRQQVHIV